MVDSAVILAAGRGARIWPYGETKAKAALPVANVPVIAHQIRCLRSLGVRRFVIVTNHLEQQVKSIVLNESVDDPVFVRQQELDGPATGLMLALEELKDDAFFVLYGDVVATIESYKALRDAWRPGLDAATLVHKMSHEEPSDWFCASVADGQVRSISSHSRSSPPHRLCGVTILSEKAREYVRAHPGMTTRLDVGAMPPMEADLSQTMQDMVDSGETVGAVETKDLFVDIDKPWDLLEANQGMAEYHNRELRKNEIADSAEISEKAEIHGPIRIGSQSRIGSGVIIEGNVTIGSRTTVTKGALIGRSIIIGSGSKVREYCKLGSRSVVGDDCIISHCAEFEGVLMNGVYLYHYCKLSGVIGTATDIGTGTVTAYARFDEMPVTHIVRGRKETPRVGGNETYIGEYCRTGVNAIMMPGTKVGPYSILGPGTITLKDVPSRTLVLAKQEQITKEWGPEKYGW